MSLLDRLFGKKSSTRKTVSTEARRLRLESLESRELLSVSTAEFNDIRSQYADLNLAVDVAEQRAAEIVATEMNAVQSASPQAALTPLAPPTIYSVTANGSNAINVKWIHPANSTGSSTIQYSTDPSFSTSTTKRVDDGVNSVNVTGLTAGTTYYVRVMSHGIGSYRSGLYLDSDYSAVMSVTTPLTSTKLVKPTLVSLVANNTTTVTVTWNPVPNADRYALYHVTDPTDPGPYIVQGTCTATTTSYTFTGLQANTTYYVWGVALGSGAYSDSDRSEMMSITTSTTSTKLAAPTLVSVVANSTTSINVTWNLVPNASQYQVHYSKDPTFSGGHIVMAPCSASASSQMITGLNPNTTYYVYVCAVGSGSYSNSDRSEIKSASTSTTTTQLATPALTCVAKSGGNALDVSWNSVANAGGYMIQYATNSTFTTGVGTKAAGSSDTSATISGLSASTTYYVRIMATGSGSYSDSNWSSAVIQKTSASTLLDTPLLTAVTATEAGKLNVSWDGVANAGGYTLQYATNSSFTAGLGTKSFFSATRSTILEELSASTTYYVRIMASGSGSYTDSAWSATKSATTVTVVSVPTAPVNFRSTAQATNSVTLSWDAQSGLTGYSLLYKKSSESIWWAWSAIAANATSVTITGLEANSSYSFQLAATNSAGSKASTASAMTTVPAPTTPVNFTSSSQTVNSVTLSWAQQAGLTCYVLEYKKSNDVAWATWTSNPAGTATTATITGLSANTAYSFRMYAVNSGGTSSAATTTATTKTVTVTVPSTPANFSGATLSTSSVSLSWTTQSGLTGYLLECKKSTATTWDAFVPSPGATATGLTVINLASNTTYDFRLSAYNSAGTSTPSIISVTTQAATLSVPQFTATGIAGGVKLTWVAINGADRYVAWRRNETNTAWIELGTVTGTTFTDTAARVGVAETYAVRAFQGTEKSSYRTVKGTALLGVPQVTATGVAGGVKLTWNAVDGADRYFAWRRNETNTAWIDLGSVTGTTLTDTAARVGVAETYAVRAYQGTKESSYVAVKGTALAGVAAPQVTATGVAGGVKLSWTAIAGADSYFAWRRNATDTAWIELGTFTGTTLTDTAARIGVAETYAVRAFRGTEKSSYLTVKGIALPVTLGVPQVTATGVAGGVKLSWDAIAGADRYFAWRRNATNTAWIELGSFTGTTLTDTTGRVNVSEIYAVRAYQGTKESSYRTVKGTALLGVPQVKATGVAGGVKLSWDAVAGADRYFAWRRNATNTAWIELGSFTGTTFTDTAARVGVAETYAVRAYQGTKESSYVAVKGTRPAIANAFFDLADAEIDALFLQPSV